MRDTLNKDLEMYNANHEGEGESSLPSQPEDQETYEARGFCAANRMFDWFDKYSVPAPGGGKNPTKSGVTAARKKKPPRQYLETDDDQVFNNT